MTTLLRVEEGSKAANAPTVLRVDWPSSFTENGLLVLNAVFTFHGEVKTAMPCHASFQWQPSNISRKLSLFSRLRRITGGDDEESVRKRG